MKRSEHFTGSIKISVADWQRDNQPLKEIRSEVFIQEQSVPVELEWDGLDDSALHLIATSTDNIAVGTARLLPDSHIGRVAVLKAWRHQGIGTALMQEATAVARAQNCQRLWLITTNDNLDAIRFYQKRGMTIAAIHVNSIAHSRTLKPSIPMTGDHGIPVRDEIEFEMEL